VSCSSAPESAKFKFELANEVAVLESANFELSNDRTVLKLSIFPYSQPTRGSGGASSAPSAGSGAEPRPKIIFSVF